MPSYDGLFIQIILKLEVFSQLLCECCHGDPVTHDNCEIGMKVETTVRLVGGGLDRSIPAVTRGRVKAHYKEGLIKGKKCKIIMTYFYFLMTFLTFYLLIDFF